APQLATAVRAAHATAQSPAAAPSAGPARRDRRRLQPVGSGGERAASRLAPRGSRADVARAPTAQPDRPRARAPRRRGRGRGGSGRSRFGPPTGTGDAPAGLTAVRQTPGRPADARMSL